MNEIVPTKIHSNKDKVDLRFLQSLMNRIELRILLINSTKTCPSTAKFSLQLTGRSNLWMINWPARRTNEKGRSFRISFNRSYRDYSNEDHSLATDSKPMLQDSAPPIDVSSLSDIWLADRSFSLLSLREVLRLLQRNSAIRAFDLSKVSQSFILLNEWT